MKRKLIALLLALTMLISMAPAVFAADTDFTDVPSGVWYGEAVAWAVENGITGGIGNGLFGPDNTCTRAQVVTFLYAAAGKPDIDVEDNPFADVTGQDWYYKAVMWAVENGITGGTSPTTFSPENPCTRAQVVTFLYAAAGKPAVEADGNGFGDVSAQDWFYVPVMWAVANNITGGIGGGQFGPDNSCTRAQIALFLYKEDQIEPSDPPVEDVTVTMIAAEYGEKTAAWWKDFEADFEAANEHIDLVVDVDSWNDIYTDIETRLANNEAPDLLNIDGFAQYQAEGLLLPAEEWISPETYAKFYPAFLNESVVDGKVWAVPDLASARALYYNADILAAAGVEAPTTWAELQAACEAIKAYDESLIPWGMDMSEMEGQATFAYYTWANGGGFVDAEGNWAVNSDENVEAVEFSVGLAKAGLTNSNPAVENHFDLMSLFADGKLAMMIASDQLAPMAADMNPDMSFGIAPIPANEGKESASIGVMDRIMCFDNDYSDAELAAIKAVMDFFYEDSRYAEWTAMEGFLPVTSGGAQAMAKENPAAAAWDEVLASVKFYPVGQEKWMEAREGVIEVQQQALQGGDVKALLDALQRKLMGYPPEPTPVEDVTVTMIAAEYGDQTADWWKRFEADFEAAHDHIDLIVDVDSWNDIYEDVNKRLANNNAPDLLNIDVYADYQAEGLLLPAKEWLSAETYAKFYPAFLNESVVDGKVWAVPDLASARALYYNADILAAAGVEAPTTWAELREVCEAVKAYDENIMPLGMDMTTDEGQATFAHYIWGNGGGFVDAEGNWALNSAENAAAVEFAVALAEDGLTNTDPAGESRYDLQMMFAEGKLAMMIAPDQLSLMAADINPDMNFGIAPIPVNKDGANASIGVMDRIMCFDNDYSAAELEAIKTVMDFFYEDTRYAEWTAMEGFLPATVSGAQAMDDPNAAAWAEILGTARFYPSYKAEWRDVRQGVINVLQQALQGGNVQELLDALQQEIAG